MVTTVQKAETLPHTQKTAGKRRGTVAVPYERRKFTWEEFHRMWEMGFFDNQRVELIDGEVVCMSPIGPPHDTGVNLSDDVLRPVFSEGYCVRVQSSFEAGEGTFPQPDIAVVCGSARDYRDKHPTTAVLILEIAETSLEYDRTVKAGLYARAGVPDYWILNLVERRLEVFRDPAEMAGEPFGFGYRMRHILMVSEEVAPLAQPEARIKVANLLP